MNDSTKLSIAILVTIVLLAVIDSVRSQDDDNLCFEAVWAEWMPIDAVAFRDLSAGCHQVADGDWREAAWYRGWCWHPANEWPAICDFSDILLAENGATPSAARPAVSQNNGQSIGQYSGCAMVCYPSGLTIVQCTQGSDGSFDLRRGAPGAKVING